MTQLTTKTQKDANLDIRLPSVLRGAIDEQASLLGVSSSALAREILGRWYLREYLGIEAVESSKVA